MPRKKSKRSKMGYYLFLYLIAALVISFVMFYVTLPNVSRLKESARITRKIMNLEETEYIEITYNVGEKNSSFVPLKDISKHLVHAVLVAEDIEFYSHKGFNFREIEEAVKKNMKEGKLVRGGSTITQQLMKNLYLTGEKTFLRKFKEALLTLKAEQYLSKDRILELYLNVVEWGYGIYGIKMASERYFRKDPKDLTPRESAYLAVLLPSPRKYSGAKKGTKIHDLLTKKQNTVIWWMQKAGYLDAEQIDSPKSVQTKAATPKVTKVIEKTAHLTATASKPDEKKAIESPNKKEEEELLDAIESFHPEEVFKKTESFKAPAER